MKLAHCGTLLLFLSLFPLHALGQCNNASMNGGYFYTLGGSVRNGASNVSYSELGQVTADGNGNLTGQSTTSIAGAITTLAITGTYSFHGDCSGTATLTNSATSSQVTLQSIDGGSTIMMSVTSSPLTLVAQGRFYRAGSATGLQCGTGTLSGAYGLLLSGGTYAGGVRTQYDEASQVTFDGQGNVSVAGMVTTATGVGTNWNATGTYTMAADCTGSVQLTNVNGTLNYALAHTEGGTLLYLETDPATTVDGSADAQQEEEVLPQLAFGGGWYTALYFTNLNAGNVTFRVTFTGDDGTPMSIPGVGTSAQIMLAPLATAIIEAPNTGGLTQGYASFALPVGVTGYGVFRQSVAGRADQEALVSFKSATSTSATLTYDDTAYITSVAIVNPSSASTTVNITLWDNNGNQIGTAALPLGAGAKTENALQNYQGLGAIMGVRGTAQFSVASGNVSVLGLRFNGFAFTSIPVTQQ